MGHDIVYRRGKRNKLQFDNSLNESYYFVRYSYDGDSLSDYESTVIVKASSENDALMKARRKLPDGSHFQVDKNRSYGDNGKFEDLSDYKKKYPHSNFRIIENEEYEEEIIEEEIESEELEESALSKEDYRDRALKAYKSRKISSSTYEKMFNWAHELSGNMDRDQYLRRAKKLLSDKYITSDMYREIVNSYNIIMLNENVEDDELQVNEGRYTGTTSVRRTAEKVLKNHHLNNSVGQYDDFVNKMWKLYKETLLDLPELEEVMEREFKKFYPHLKESEVVERTCVCGNTEFVEEDGELVCTECGRPAVVESAHDIEGGEISDKELEDLDAERLEESEDSLVDKIKNIFKSEKGEFVEEEEKRTDGRRLIRSEPHDMTTADRPNIEDTIAEALGMRIKR